MRAKRKCTLMQNVCDRMSGMRAKNPQGNGGSGREDCRVRCLNFLALSLSVFEAQPQQCLVKKSIDYDWNSARIACEGVDNMNT